MVGQSLSKSTGSMFWPDCSIPIFARMDPYGDGVVQYVFIIKGKWGVERVVRQEIEAESND